MSAISKAIRKQYRGLWRVDRALENDRLRAGLPIRHSPSARPLGNSTQKTQHGLYSRSPAAWEVAAALNLRIGSPISRYSRAIDLILFNLPSSSADRRVGRLAPKDPFARQKRTGEDHKSLDAQRRPQDPFEDRRRWLVMCDLGRHGRHIRACQRHRSWHRAAGQGRPIYNPERAVTRHSITSTSLPRLEQAIKAPKEETGVCHVGRHPSCSRKSSNV